MPIKYKPTLLIVLDGWGLREESESNAVKLSKTPAMDHLIKEFPHTALQASGEFVGLPKGLMGNSEVGHLNIGAGRIVYQDIVRISRAIQDRSFFKNSNLLKIFSDAKKNQRKVHLLGLLSDGGVHSSFEHLEALIQMAKQEQIQHLIIHAFLDGRDTPPKSALIYLERLEKVAKKFNIGLVGSVSGRYYAMDRDKRWDRLEKAYRALVLGEGIKIHSAREAVLNAYERGETDEFVLPTLIIPDSKKEAALIQDGDGVIFFNFRADRARELTAALTTQNFPGFQLKQPKISFCGMTRYDDQLTVSVAFEDENLKNTISEVWSQQGLKQFHTAETEKYAHVTYFFGGGRETPFPGEDRLLIPSLKIPTYDLQPEMSAVSITETCLEKIQSDAYDCIAMNFANADMVGHTGNLKATIKAVEVVDTCIGKLTEAVLKKKGLAAITADHGNAEIKWDPAAQQPSTAHTTNPVPFIFVCENMKGKKLKKDGILADIAPTILLAQGIKPPAEMTGKNLLLNESLL
jgi:2,3-bisphosphoglycerate-independent phosphoglycerate mutase